MIQYGGGEGTRLPIRPRSGSPSYRYPDTPAGQVGSVPHPTHPRGCPSRNVIDSSSLKVDPHFPRPLSNLVPKVSDPTSLLTSTPFVVYEVPLGRFTRSSDESPGPWDLRSGDVPSKESLSSHSSPHFL